MSAAKPTPLAPRWDGIPAALRELIVALDPEAPADVRGAAGALSYRDFLTVALIPLLQPLALRLRLVDSPGARKIHTDPIPRVGGIAVSPRRGAIRWWRRPPCPARPGGGRARPRWAGG